MPVMQLSEEQTESYASTERNPFSRNCKFISAIVSLSKVSKTFTLGGGGGMMGSLGGRESGRMKILESLRTTPCFLHYFNDLSN